MEVKNRLSEAQIAVKATWKRVATAITVRTITAT